MTLYFFIFQLLNDKRYYIFVTYSFDVSGAMAQTVRLSDYDVIGFDLDNTLLEYNLSKIFLLQYEFLSNYMVECKSYSRSAFPQELTPEDADFFIRGLFLDFRRGNVLHLRDDGFIIKATHGTIPLSNDIIEDIYGKSRKWAAINSFIADKLSLWDSSDARTFLDFTDSIVPLIFAKAVDSFDKENTVNECKVWPDVLEAVVEMYKSDSTYILALAANISEYFFSCDDSIISWLKALKKHSKLLLITGAEAKVANISVPYCFGGKHFELFDLIICDAKKPGFFSKQRPFQAFSGEAQISINSKEKGIIYRYGNWSDIYGHFQSLFGRPLNCVYIGDNPIQDVYAPTKMQNKIDSIAVVKELASEGLHPNSSDYLDSLYVSSKFWGPFLYSSSGDVTMIGSVLRESAKLVVPSVKFMATKPIDFEFHNILNTILKKCPK